MTQTTPGDILGTGHMEAGPAQAPGNAYVVGVDLGGTRLRAGVVDSAGDVLCTVAVPSATGLPPEDNPGYLAGLIDALLADAGLTRTALRGIGIGTTGPVDTVTGRIDNPYTLPGWSGVDVTGTLIKHFGAPVRIDNDAAVAALGEYWMGAGVGSNRMAMVTIGTGIGGALVIDGRVYSGAGGFHPEVGHQAIEPGGPLCYCGIAGCWEQLAAGPAIARAWADARRARGDTGSLQAGSEDLFAAGRAGDADAQTLIARIARYLGLGLINVIAFYAPNLIVLGGGVAEHFDLFEPGMREVLDQLILSRPPGGVLLRASQLGEAAGILGGAHLALTP